MRETKVSALGVVIVVVDFAVVVVDDVVNVAIDAVVAFGRFMKGRNKMEDNGWRGIWLCQNFDMVLPKANRLSENVVRWYNVSLSCLLNKRSWVRSQLALIYSLHRKQFC